MAKKKEKKAALNVLPRMFKGYDMRWLKSIPEHPSFGLVAEYEEKYKVTV